MVKRYVLLGDVVRSSKVRDTEGFQRRLQHLLRLLNEKFARDLDAEFKILKGIDEIGAVLRSLKPVPAVLREAFFALSPVILRVVVVYGKISVGFSTEDVTQMDGPAFHEAADLMENLKRERLFFRLKAHFPLLDQAISGQVNALTLLKLRWTPEQVEVIRAYRQHRSQLRVASLLGISQQAVSDRLRRAHWAEIHRLETELETLLHAYEDSYLGNRALRWSR